MAAAPASLNSALRRARDPSAASTILDQQDVHSPNSSDTAAYMEPLNGANGGGTQADDAANSEGVDGGHEEGEEAGHREGEARLQLDCTEVSLERAPDAMHVYLLLEGTVAGRAVRPIRRDAVMAVCYVHRWFTQAPVNADLYTAWDELRNCLRTSIAMGRYLGTPGEDLVQNVALWARFRIRSAYPPDANLFGMFDPWDSEPDESED
ncbi:hypothetical protein TRAPUB_1275 [Trametes pubescens]|uniref:Uncharacterized protein n=1 Tax=Trametes pubescens TaxID=154538 RepID=A0A1M2VJQ2_TRAPU|nr:hypothetical protein TRAPUB_1275 [Trametes pubescens]